MAFYTEHGSGRRRADFDYHTMANNAVFPLNAHGSPFREPDHPNTKHNASQLKPEYAPTLS